MNPLLNPFNTLPVLKTYLFDAKRLKKLKPDQMEKYKEKSFKKILKYAYTVPLYHEKYKKAGINLNDIKGLADISKIPMVSKNEIREGFPDKILPRGINKKNEHVICTGGTTGKSISIYTDFYTMGKSGVGMERELNSYNLTWKNSKLAHIGNFNPCRIDLVIEEHFHKYLKPFISYKNKLNLDVNIPSKEILEKLEKFRPDLIVSYPAVYQHLAFLKRKGLGKNVNPKVLFAVGEMLDDYTRNYVNDAFKCPVLNSYQSVEAHGVIASECIYGTWHVHTDLYHVEAVDDDGMLVSPGKRGHLVLTRLWGKGTPIVRYTGMDDWVRIIFDKECKCGLRTPIIEGGVEGRKKANIVLPSGKIFPPGAFCFIEPILTKYKTFVVKQYQIIQKTLHEIDVLLVIDEDLRNINVPLDTIKKEIKTLYESKVGPDVTINIIEVKEIKNEENPRKPPPIVKSYVKMDEGYNVLDSSTKNQK